MPVVAECMLREKSEWWTSRQEQFMDRNVRSLPLIEKEVQELGTKLNVGSATAVCLVDW